MRLLYHHRILARDGMRVHVEELTGALGRRGHTLAVVGPGEGSVRSASRGRAGDRLRRLREGPLAGAGEMMEIAYNLKALRDLNAATRRHRPQILYERYNSFLTAGLRLKRRFGLPMLVEVNAPLCEERLALGNLRFVQLARAMERKVWQGADALLPVSEVLAGHLRAAGTPAGRIHVIPNGVRLEAFTGRRDEEVRRELGVAGRTVFGFVGFVRAWHGLDRVLELFARLPQPDLHLLVIGEGPASADLRAAATRLGLSARLTFAGTRPHAEIPRLLRAVDVALQPDVTPYASPLKLFEYMAAGCAVIAPDRPNIREIVEHGRNALLFDPDRPGALEEAITALAGSTELRHRLGDAARREIVSKDRTWDGNARRIETIAERLLSAGTGQPGGDGHG